MKHCYFIEDSCTCIQAHGGKVKVEIETDSTIGLVLDGKQSVPGFQVFRHRIARSPERIDCIKAVVSWTAMADTI